MAKTKAIAVGDQVACREYDFVAGEPIGKRWTGIVVSVDRTLAKPYTVTRPGDLNVDLTRFEIKKVIMRAKEEPCTPVLATSPQTLSVSQAILSSMPS